jgi:hypothetical protein
MLVIIEVRVATPPWFYTVKPTYATVREVPTLHMCIMDSTSPLTSSLSSLPAHEIIFLQNVIKGPPHQIRIAQK